MSVTYDIICKDCKKSLWIGQSSRTFYSGMPEVMEALKEFLFNHVHHNLLFEPMEWWDQIPDDWEEIDANPKSIKKRGGKCIHPMSERMIEATGLHVIKQWCGICKKKINFK